MEVSLTLHNYLFAPGLSEMNVTHPSAETKWALLFSIRMGPGWKGSQPQDIMLKHSLYFFDESAFILVFQREKKNDKGRNHQKTLHIAYLKNIHKNPQELKVQETIQNNQNNRSYWMLRFHPKGSNMKMISTTTVGRIYIFDPCWLLNNSLFPMVEIPMMPSIILRVCASTCPRMNPWSHPLQYLPSTLSI